MSVGVLIRAEAFEADSVSRAAARSPEPMTMACGWVARSDQWFVQVRRLADLAVLLSDYGCPGGDCSVGLDTAGDTDLAILLTRYGEGTKRAGATRHLVSLNACNMVC